MVTPFTRGWQDFWKFYHFEKDNLASPYNANSEKDLDWVSGMLDAQRTCIRLYFKPINLY